MTLIFRKTDIWRYISNEQATDVFFDNVQVLHYKGRLLEEQHYYPFGLTMRAGSNDPVPNRYLWQGKELQDEVGLKLYDFHARQYDPQIGRFGGIDPADQFPSGYTGMGNDPGNLIDPDGCQVSMGGGGASPRYNPYDFDASINAMRQFEAQSDMRALQDQAYHNYLAGGASGSSSRPVIFSQVGQGESYIRYNGSYFEYGTYLPWTRVNLTPARTYEATYGNTLIPMGMLSRNDNTIRSSYIDKNVSYEFNYGPNFSDKITLMGAVVTGMENTYSSVAKTIPYQTISAKMTGAARGLQALAWGLTAVSVAVDVNDYETGQISGQRFGFHLGATGASIYAGYMFGSWPGMLVGSASYVGEKSYYGFNWYMGELSKGITNFNNALSNGWRPTW